MIVTLTLFSYFWYKHQSQDECGPDEKSSAEDWCKDIDVLF